MGLSSFRSSYFRVREFVFSEGGGVSVQKAAQIGWVLGASTLAALLLTPDTDALHCAEIQCDNPDTFDNSCLKGGPGCDYCAANKRCTFS